jgi:hypothetical protein
MQTKIAENIHKQYRAQIECTFRELHADAQATVEIWRHKKILNPYTYLLACELYNFRKRSHINRGFQLYQMYTKTNKRSQRFFRILLKILYSVSFPFRSLTNVW